ncbi:MAG TPA: hypothetical protein VLG28_18435 [Acidimicrobiia bacterium]|nr:hypothetical protein [Acidimicrobiia bacterium]
MRPRTAAAFVATLLVMALAAPAGAAAPEQVDIMNQGGVGVYAKDAVSVVRQPNSLQVKASVPTPQPGTYVYAPGTVAGSPEVFTLWAFVFNYPDLCDGPCDGNDLGLGAEALGGAYNVGGHVAGAGGQLTITGHINVGDPAGAPPPIFVGAPLESPSTAEIHVALAPHGALDPSTLPGELSMPVGNPGCGCWWVGVLIP